MIPAVSQLLAFAALLVGGYWVNGVDHAEDGIDVPLRRLAERRSWMAVGPGRDPLLEVAA